MELEDEEVDEDWTKILSTSKKTLVQLELIMLLRFRVYLYILSDVDKSLLAKFGNELLSIFMMIFLNSDNPSIQLPTCEILVNLFELALPFSYISELESLPLQDYEYNMNLQSPLVKIIELDPLYPYYHVNIDYMTLGNLIRRALILTTNKKSDNDFGIVFFASLIGILIGISSEYFSYEEHYNLTSDAIDTVLLRLESITKRLYKLPFVLVLRYIINFAKVESLQEHYERIFKLIEKIEEKERKKNY